MKAALASLAANPLTYVIGFAVGGAASVVCGIAILVGSGWALVASGAFLIGASGYITQGMKSNG
jgi:hypothetical protein